ncbi:MAG: hypothetical protein ABSA64_11110 [Sedimentisphaerales bacterium]
MSDERINMVQKWLASAGQSWVESVESASSFLLRDYLKKWEHLIPVELHRLASTLHAEVVRLNDLEGEAVIMPKNGGFRILVKSSMTTSRYRTSVAHELVHTLFYTDSNEGTPQRAIPHSKREENFCFDVARYLLAPKEHLEKIGVFRESDPTIVFNMLTQTLRLSRPLAARVMLADYPLATGIGGRWILKPIGWKLEPGSSTASPCLSEREKTELRKVAKGYLEHPEKRIENLNFFAINEKNQNGVFLLVFTKCGIEEKSESCQLRAFQSLFPF